MTVHPAAGHYDDTLVNALLFHCKESLSGIGGILRPGIVHRLDKDTSGVMIVAKMIMPIIIYLNNLQNVVSKDVIMQYVMVHQIPRRVQLLVILGVRHIRDRK